MSGSVHGHQVMQLMLAHDAPLTKEALIALMAETFGENSHYHTCSASQMDAKALIDFLEKKGKFIQDGDNITTAANKICKH